MLSVNKVFFTISIFVCIVGLTTGVNAPVVGFLKDTWFEEFLYSWSPVVFNVSCGYLISLFMWYLFVYRPYLHERNIIKNNIVVQYKRFKWSTINLLLHACDAEDKAYNSIDELCEYKKFREFFDKAKWYAVLNGLSDDNGYLDSIRLEIEIFYNDVSYVLNNVSFKDSEAHERFIILNENLFRLTQDYSCRVEYEKSLTTFIRSLLAQISVVDGVLDRDVVQEMIDSI